eukprot:m.200978 g.200978  ORF g.200978 m.200978 type:complete len:573 (-) comp10670_c0_seq3:138-1856(-)
MSDDEIPRLTAAQIAELGGLLASGLWDDFVMDAFFVVLQCSSAGALSQKDQLAALAQCEPLVRGVMQLARDRVRELPDGTPVYELAMHLIANLAYACPDPLLEHVDDFCQLYDLESTYAFERTYMLTLLNLVLWGTNGRARLLDAGIVAAVQPLFESDDPERFSFMAALLMAILIGNDEHSQFIHPRHSQLFDHIEQILRNALDDDVGSTYQDIKWSALSPTRSLSVLSTADVHKPILVKTKVLPLLCQLLARSKPTVMDDEKDFRTACKSAVSTIWNLSFACNIEKAAPGMRNALRNLLQQSFLDRELRGLTERVLFELGTTKPPSPTKDSASSPAFLCFSTTGKASVSAALAEALSARGYAVASSADIQTPSQSGLVERARLVLIEVSACVKESAACRAEMDIAECCGRELVALNIDPNYKPDGWLSRMVEGRPTIAVGSDSVEKWAEAVINYLGDSFLKPLAPAAAPVSAVPATTASDECATSSSGNSSDWEDIDDPADASETQGDEALTYLQEHEDLFRQNGINSMQALAQCSVSDLVALGVTEKYAKHILRVTRRRKRCGEAPCLLM